MINLFIASWVLALACTIRWNVRLHRLPLALKWSDLTIWDKVTLAGAGQFLVLVGYILLSLGANNG